jgi:hypothetical protein
VTPAEIKNLLEDARKAFKADVVYAVLVAEAAGDVLEGREPRGPERPEYIACTAPRRPMTDQEWADRLAAARAEIRDKSLSKAR